MRSFIEPDLFATCTLQGRACKHRFS